MHFSVVQYIIQTVLYYKIQLKAVWILLRTDITNFLTTLRSFGFVRITALQRMGVYDTITVALSKNVTQEKRATEVYYHVPGLCDIPRHQPHIRDTVVTYNETTRLVCRDLCSSVHSDSCSSVLFDNQTRSCVLSSYTGSVGDLDPGCDRLSGREFYRRMRNVGKDY